ncbi:hypothetical protein DID74_01765 [Candidatus Marinamargulisbacteria bacterium SCGC AG-333-B06]|nr:hypothetical protein DID74_01765 [Candidatus Marinamargulisbacteria bacterium SCGC AG-333-B06]
MKNVTVFRKYIIFLIGLLMSSAALSYAQSDITSPKGSGGYSITGFDREGARTVGGYFDTEFIAEENKNTTFRAHRFVLEASSQVSDKVLVSSEIEFEYGANTANDGVIKIEQAWVDYQINELITQRTGIIVVPFGRVNVLHDSDVRDATQRPLYAKYIVPSTWMDTGAGIHGNASFGDIDINYQAYVINGLNEGIASANGVRNARPSYKTDNNGDKAIVGRVGVSPLLGLELGGSIYNGKYSNSGTDGLLMVGGDAFYKMGRYEAIAEAAIVNIDEKGSIPQRMRGGYLELRAHVLQEQLRDWIPSLRSPVITLFGRAGYVDTDRANEYVTNRLMVGFNFRPTETAAYKFEYQVEDYKNPGNSGSQDAFIASVAVGF